MKKRLVLLLSSILLLVNISGGCHVKYIQPLKTDFIDNIETKVPDSEFIMATSDYALTLFKAAVEPEHNVMISPLSLMWALAMTTNGAVGQTKKELEALLRCGDINELNKYLAGLLDATFAEQQLKIANSLWIIDRADIVVMPDFLQTVLNYYNAEIFQEKFDEATLQAVNKWVKDKTKGMIPQVLNELDPETVMLLINAVAFEATWAVAYDKSQIAPGIFHNIKGEEEDVEYMYATENYFIEDGQATGFIKHYQDNDYAFVALLPNEGVAISDYIAQLQGTELIKMLSNREQVDVRTVIPKFQYETTVDMTSILKQLGVETAFDPDAADFSGLLDCSKSDNAYISEVIHKTFIAVDELGTKAGAATVVVINTKAALPQKEYEVVLNRPFLYLIIDTTSNLPLFIGTVLTSE